MALNQSLSQKQLQKLSPQQIQLMKLLQIPTATLEQRIKEELEANPALDEGEDFEEEVEHSEDEFYEDTYGDKKEDAAEKEEKTDADIEEYDNVEAESIDYEEFETLTADDNVELDDYIQDYIEDDVASYKLSINNSSPDDEEKTVPVTIQNSFHEHLEEQLGMKNLTERAEIIAKQVIGSIDDDGYLRREPIALVDDLVFSQNIMVEEREIIEMIALVQTFDPPGIGARDLQESLSIQLHRKLEEKKLDNRYEDVEIIELAIKAIDKYFDEFAKKHYEKLKRHLSVDEEDLKLVIAEVVKLNPKPASGYSSNSGGMTYYIVPDFIIQNRDGELDLTLNSRNAPDLRINSQYKTMLQTYKATKSKGKRASKQDREAVMFIKNKIDSAKWFIDAIVQRQQTMLRTMYTIMQFQEEFFLTGDQKTLRPMILKDIADVTGLDISTVSRVANSKYVQTEFGTKRLKDFFSESLQTADGEEVSTLEVKKILTELIEKENKRKPLSDEKLKNALREKGYNIARRTVAKYREQLNIPVARLRKKLV